MIMDNAGNSVVRSKWDAKTITLIGMMTAVICVLGPISVPIPGSPVPISLGTLAVLFTVYVLGMKKGTFSCLIYILLGLVGLPVFSSYSGGPAKLFGPTGGYIFGYIFMALLSGYFIEKWTRKRYMQFIGLVIGVAICYLFGTMWLSIQASMTFYAALAAGVIPFIPADLIKIIIVLIIGPEIRKRLAAAGLV
jgi:biotin transport system substrate-specific component